jgi:methionyl-tRNA formyltransferase
MNVLLAGQKWFGAEVFRALRKHKEISVACVCAPVGGEREDKLAAQADLWRVPIIPSGSLKAATMPQGIDLIVAAHSHDFIGEKTRLRATHGGIGYHPSLLPLHRGRDAVRWTIRMGDRIAGGSVYRLANRMDGGNIIAQKHVFVRPGETAQSLWRDLLCPLGVELLAESVLRFAREGFVNGEPQDETVATWEPSIDRPPAYRPDLIMLPFSQ